MNKPSPPIDPRPQAHATHVPMPMPRPSAHSSEYQRGRFEQALSRRSASSQDEEETQAAPNAPALLAQERLLWQDDTESDLQADLGSGDRTLAAMDLPRTTPTAALPELPVPAPAFNVIASNQTQLYQHMAMPLSAPDGALHFAVLNPKSMVSSVEFSTSPQGSLSVLIGTSVEHASLMDRHLPQLQRKLSERAATHLRVQESDAERN